MKKLLLFILFLKLSTQLTAQLVNINPNPNSDPWWVFGVSPVTPEIQAEIDQVPNLVLSAISLQTNLPTVVDNSQEIFMRPVFNQKDGCCAQASGIGYTFTYEINRLRDSSAIY